MSDSTYDYEALLALEGMRETQVFRGQATALYPDGTVDVRYEGLPQGTLGGAVAWLQTNRAVITDQTISGVKMEGAWRTVAIQEQLVVEGGRKTGTVLVQKFAKGLYDKLDWSVCRVQEGKWAIGNTKNADSVAGTTSAAPARWHTIRMPYVRPDKAKVIADGIVDESWTDLVAGGVKHDGVWYNLGATFRLEEDQTASVSITIAQPIFTTEGYRNAGTYESEQRFLVANVPTQSIQGILDAWKSGRKGADGVIESLHTDRNTANLILTVPVPVAKSSQRVRTTEDAFKTVTETTDINQAAAKAQPAFAAGTIVEVSNEETPLGKFNITTETRTAKTGETPKHVVTILHDGTTIERHSARHLVKDGSSYKDADGNVQAWAAEPSAAPAVGTGLSISREKNDFCGYVVTRTEMTVTETRRPATGGTFYEYTRGASKVYHYEYDGVEPARLVERMEELVAYAATHTISAEPRFDAETGTFSLSVTAYPAGGSSGGGSKAMSETWEETARFYHTIQHKDTGDPILYYRDVSYNCGRIQSADEDDVTTFVDGQENVRYGPLGRWGFFGEYKTPAVSGTSEDTWTLIG